jgi:dephospho-CoA kinase
MKKIYAIVGMAGSGKSEAIKFFQDKYGWPKVYFGEPTFDRIKKDGLELNYDNEKIIREKIRSELGMGAYAILALPNIKKLLEKHDVVLLESLYSWDEYKIVKNEFGDALETIAVFTPFKIRLDRLSKRKDWRPIEAANELKKRDWTEIEGTDKGGPIAIADYTVINEGEREQLHEQLDIITNLPANQRINNFK